MACDRLILPSVNNVYTFIGLNSNLHGQLYTKMFMYVDMNTYLTKVGFILQPTTPALHEPKFYINQLRAHMNPNVHSLKKVPKKLVKDLLPARVLLGDLKEDLRAYNTE